MMHLEADVFRKFDKQWALVTAGTPEHYNTMTISWGGLGTLWRRPVATVYVKKNRYTFEFMEQSDISPSAFTLRRSAGPCPCWAAPPAGTATRWRRRA